MSLNSTGSPAVQGGQEANTPTEQPEAIRLADALAYCDNHVASRAAAELRRLHAAREADREAMRQAKEAAEKAGQAIDDWVATYADDLCGAEHVAAAHKRISDCGGTLAYTASAIETLDAAISKLRARVG